MGKPANHTDKPIDIKSQVEAEVTRQLHFIRALILAFLAGLCLLIGAGLSFKEIFLLPLMKYIYPPQTIWEEAVSGNEKNLSVLPSKDAFYTSLEAKFDNELTNAFGIPGSVFAGRLTANEVLRKKILKMAGEAQRADIRQDRDVHDFMLFYALLMW